MTYVKNKRSKLATGRVEERRAERLTLLKLSPALPARLLPASTTPTSLAPSAMTPSSVKSLIEASEGRGEGPGLDAVSPSNLFSTASRSAGRLGSTRAGEAAGAVAEESCSVGGGTVGGAESLSTGGWGVTMGVGEEMVRAGLEARGMGEGGAAEPLTAACASMAWTVLGGWGVESAAGRGEDEPVGLRAGEAAGERP